MGETSVYYVPRDEERWIGRELEAAKRFWQEGIFGGEAELEWDSYGRRAFPLTTRLPAVISEESSSRASIFPGRTYIPLTSPAQT